MVGLRGGGAKTAQGEPVRGRGAAGAALVEPGRSSAGIPAALVISGGAVEKHVARVFGKLGLPPSEGGNRRVLAVLRYLGG